MVPWSVRIAAKLVLSRLPVPYAFWKRLRLFEHGTMDQPERSLSTFIEHAATAGLIEPADALPRLPSANGGFTVLELGPGDSLFTAAIARSLGAEQTWLVDAGAFAGTDAKPYARLADLLRQRGYGVECAAPASVAEVLLLNHGRYLIDGVRSLAELSESSVDYCYSNAVLEHIPKRDFAVLASELVRVLKPGGVSVHRVDLKDHLGGGLNNLRFSETTWEADLFRNAGFYTNRLRFREMVGIFERAGFDCHMPRVIRWDVLPVDRASLAPCFRELADEDLLVSGFDIVLRRKPVVS